MEAFGFAYAKASGAGLAARGASGSRACRTGSPKAWGTALPGFVAPSDAQACLQGTTRPGPSVRREPDPGRRCGGSQVRADGAAGARSGPTVRREPGPGPTVRREPGPGRRCGGSQDPGRRCGGSRARADGAAGAGPGPTVRREPDPGRRCGGSRTRADVRRVARSGPTCGRVRPDPGRACGRVRPGPGRPCDRVRQVRDERPARRGRGTSRIGGLLPWASGVRPGQRNGVARGRRYGLSRAIFAATCASDPRSGDRSRFVSSATVMWSSGYRDRWV